MNRKERILSRVGKDNLSGCWIWRGYLGSVGYGKFHETVCGEQITIGAHRASYEEFRGEIPNGYQIDHLCRNRACVNPEHLEAVSQRENVLRGIGRAAENHKKTQCVRGHDFDSKNTYIWLTKSGNTMRQCRKCNALRQAEKYRTATNGNVA